MSLSEKLPQLEVDKIQNITASLISEAFATLGKTNSKYAWLAQTVVVAKAGIAEVSKSVSHDGHEISQIYRPEVGPTPSHDVTSGDNIVHPDVKSPPASPPNMIMEPPSTPSPDDTRLPLSSNSSSTIIPGPQVSYPSPSPSAYLPIMAPPDILDELPEQRFAPVNMVPPSLPPAGPVSAIPDPGPPIPDPPIQVSVTGYVQLEPLQKQLSLEEQNNLKIATCVAMHRIIAEALQEQALGSDYHSEKTKSSGSEPGSESQSSSVKSQCEAKVKKKQFVYTVNYEISMPIVYTVSYKISMPMPKEMSKTVSNDGSNQNSPLMDFTVPIKSIPASNNVTSNSKTLPQSDHVTSDSASNEDSAESISLAARISEAFVTLGKTNSKYVFLAQTVSVSIAEISEISKNDDHKVTPQRSHDIASGDNAVTVDHDVASGDINILDQIDTASGEEDNVASGEKSSGSGDDPAPVSPPTLLSPKTDSQQLNDTEKKKSESDSSAAQIIAYTVLGALGGIAAAMAALYGIWKYKDSAKTTAKTVGEKLNSAGEKLKTLSGKWKPKNRPKLRLRRDSRRDGAGRRTGGLAQVRVARQRSSEILSADDMEPKLVGFTVNSNGNVAGDPLITSGREKPREEAAAGPLTRV